MSNKDRILGVLNGMSDEQKERFKSAPKEKQLEIVKGIASRLDGREIEPLKVDPQSTSMNIGQALQREEAAVAQPILEILRRNKPSFGEDVSNRGFLDSAKAGLSGETFSKFNEGRQAELGDIFRELGLPDSVSATLGLVASSLLPSSIVGGLAARAVGKPIKQATIKAGEKVKDVTGKGLFTPGQMHTDINSDSISKFRNLFSQIEKNSTRTKVEISEVMESLTGIKSEKILFLMDNPSYATREWARDSKIQEIAEKTSSSLMNKPKDYFKSYDESIPLQIADQISSEFDSLISSAGKRVSEAKKLAKEMSSGDLDRRINTFDIKKYIDDLIEQKNGYEIIDGKRKLIPSAKKNKEVETLLNIKNQIDGLFPKAEKAVEILDQNGIPINIAETNSKNIPFEKIQLLLDNLDDIAFSQGNTVVGQGGITQPMKDVTAMTKLVRGYIKNLVTDKYKDVPDYVDAFSDFAKLAEIRSSAGRIAKDSKSLAKTIRGLDKKLPEDLEAGFNQIMEALPNYEAYKLQIENFLDQKANSPDQIFDWLGSRSKKDVESKLMAILKKDTKELTAREADALEAVLGREVLTDVMGHKVAKDFSKSANIFRALAAGGTIGAASGNAMNAVFGYVLTDPRVQGKLIKVLSESNAGKKILNSTGKTLKNVLKGANTVKNTISPRNIFMPSLSRGSVRNLVQESQD